MAIDPDAHAPLAAGVVPLPVPLPVPGVVPGAGTMPLPVGGGGVVVVLPPASHSTDPLL